MFKRSFLICSLLLSFGCDAQQQFGQLVINGGVGYSPVFQSADDVTSVLINSPQINYLNIDATLHSFSTVPYLGIAVDYGLFYRLGIGIAGGSQNYAINYSLSGGSAIFSDKITRNNLAGRLLYHLGKTNTVIDEYLGFRLGCSYWNDTPSPTNLCAIGIDSYLSTTNYRCYSFQILYGIRFYLENSFGIHAEIGIGSPYFMEGGITFRINTIKQKDANKSN